MKRPLIIIVSGLALLFLVCPIIKYIAGEWYLATENSNFAKNREKSKLDCGKLPIHCAIRDKNSSVLAGLKEHDPLLESRDGWSHTPLYYAIVHVDKEAVKILLRKKANPDARDENGSPALLTAVRMKRYDIAEALLKSGGFVDIEGADKDKISPIGFCVAYNDVKCVRLLLGYGADVDRKSSRHIAGRQYSVYEIGMKNSNVGPEIKSLLQKKHNQTLQPSTTKNTI